jgi:hypothetical protein
MSDSKKTTGDFAGRAMRGAALITVAVLLAGCSPSAPAPDASPTASDEERYQAQLAEERLEALVDPITQLPNATLTTPAGTELAAGAWAVVGREWASDQTTMTVGVVPVSATAGDLERDFAYLPDDERAKLGVVTPLYVDYQFALLDGERMYPATTGIQLVLSDGSIADIPIIVGGMGPSTTDTLCPREPAASDFPQEIGDVYQGCKTFLIPEGLDAVSVQWGGEGIYTTEGVRWPVPVA